MRPPKMETPKSPFFHPSAPKKQTNIQTSIKKSPGGTRTRTIKKVKSQSFSSKDKADEEHKAGILGTCGNVINSIVGAGIVGIPYAMQQTGLVSGIFMILLVTLMTEKSLRLLIETAKYIDVPSYEMLFEACFGKFGFLFLSFSMFIMSYGGMISYLMIVRDTLPVLMGVEGDNIRVNNIILIFVTAFIMFPISSQRDMADLAKTSNIAVLFDMILVGIVIFFSPAKAAIEDSGGLYTVVSKSIMNPSTFFVGIGVLSFAFVCQHSSFIIAGSLSKPTNKRWGTVTLISLIIVGFLELSMGTIGYLTFQEDTVGNILNNFTPEHIDAMSDSIGRASNVCRALLCTTMICVFPMDVFVTRHVSVVLFFKGRRAHEGDDHSVLARWDRRIILTGALVISALIPALLCSDLGAVLSISGSVGGSCVSYIGPGCTYLGIHGQKFLELVDTIWKHHRQQNSDNIELAKLNVNQQDLEDSSLLTDFNNNRSSTSILHTISWYLLLMPVWCAIASFGSKVFKDFQEEQLLKSPHLNRLAAGNQQHVLVKKSTTPTTGNAPTANKVGLSPLLPRTMSLPNDELSINPPSDILSTPKQKMQYGAISNGSTDRTIAAAIAAKYRSSSENTKTSNQDNDNDDEYEQNDINPKWIDFIIAIFFILFGIIAMFLGLICVFVS